MKNHLCIYLGCATSGPLAGTMPLSHWKHDLMLILHVLEGLLSEILLFLPLTVGEG